MVRQRIADDTLHLSGWWFDIARGEMQLYDRESRKFQPLTRDVAERYLERFDPA
jgi:hypothetical protein